MSSKEQDYKEDYKSGEGKASDVYDTKDSYDDYKADPPQIEITSIKITPDGENEISAPLELYIRFELDRDVVAGYWVIQFLVDSSNKRIIKVLGETEVEDYPDGESDMVFSTSEINVSGIAASTLANSGLLMAKFMADGEEVASVNMVVTVSKKDGRVMRDIISPLD